MIEYQENFEITSDYVYLKIYKGNVEAYGDIASLENAEAEMQTGRLFDYAVPVDEWASNGSVARIASGKVVLGLPPEQIREEQAETIRWERYLRLRQCDKISPMRWNAMTSEEQQAWTDYRIALLNIPQHKDFPWDGDPDKVPWPKQPE